MDKLRLWMKAPRQTTQLEEDRDTMEIILNRKNYLSSCSHVSPGNTNDHAVNGESDHIEALPGFEKSVLSNQKNKKAEKLLQNHLNFFYFKFMLMDYVNED